jgi:hypothetical protein
MSGVWLGGWLDGWRDDWRGRWRSRRGRLHRHGRNPYNRWVNAPIVPATDHFVLPAALMVDDAIRIAEAITASHAESTRSVYAIAWNQWERWCAAREVTALPAAPAMICAYLTARAAQGLSVGTLDLACGAIAYRHRMHGLDDPVLSEGVRQVRRGLRRIVGTAPRRQARPLRLGEIRRIVAAIDRTTGKGARDAAIILVGFASAMRRSELARLTLADVEVKPGGVLLQVCRSKTDQDGDGQVVAVAQARTHSPTLLPRSTHGWSSVAGRPVLCSPA